MSLLLDKLNTAYKDIFYIDDGHRYINKSLNKELISVTTVIEKYKQEFKEDYWSKYKAKEYGVSQEKVLQNWKLKNKFGLYLGSQTHEYIENYGNRKIINTNTLSSFSYLPSYQFLTLVKYQENLLYQANQFIKDYDISKRIVSELVVGNKVIAGQIDYLEEDRIIDFKCDREIDFSNPYQKMKYPLNYLDDCSWNKYCIQVSMYRYLLEEKGFELSGQDIIVKFDRYSKEYKVYEIPYLKKECELILNKLK